MKSYSLKELTEERRCEVEKNKRKQGLVEPRTNQCTKRRLQLMWGEGKYKETFKYKNPIIHTCGKCRGTGNVKIRVSFIGETDVKTGLWKWGIYDLISESESNYVIQNKKNELMQMPKVMFKLDN